MYDDGRTLHLTAAHDTAGISTLHAQRVRDLRAEYGRAQDGFNPVQAVARGVQAVRTLIAALEAKPAPTRAATQEVVCVTC